MKLSLKRLIIVFYSDLLVRPPLTLQLTDAGLTVNLPSPADPEETRSTQREPGAWRTGLALRSQSTTTTTRRVMELMERGETLQGEQTKEILQSLFVRSTSRPSLGHMTSGDDDIEEF